jgi:hypothetical protein
MRAHYRFLIVGHYKFHVWIPRRFFSLNTWWSQHHFGFSHCNKSLDFSRAWGLRPMFWLSTRQHCLFTVLDPHVNGTSRPPPRLRTSGYNCPRRVMRGLDLILPTHETDGRKGLPDGMANLAITAARSRSRPGMTSVWPISLHWWPTAMLRYPVDCARLLHHPLDLFLEEFSYGMQDALECATVKNI